jgi:hypothetical protein
LNRDELDQVPDYPTSRQEILSNRPEAIFEFPIATDSNFS